MGGCPGRGRRGGSPLVRLLSIAAGGLLLLWPALWNGYPLLFSDTGALLEMSLEPTMGWDKPWVYPPFMHLFHWRTALWPVAVAQAMLLSAVLWAVGSTVRAEPAEALGLPDRPFDNPGAGGSVQPTAYTAYPVQGWFHLALCLVLAALTAAPWFASLLMPDFFTPIAVLCLVLLAARRGWGWAVLGAVAIASHLSHLPMAAACIVALGVLHRRWPWRPAGALAGAVALLLLINSVGFGRATLSPHGSVFALARLIGDGPGRWYIDRVCPGAGLKLCAWQGRLATDSDDFLWAPYGPLWDRSLWGDAFGPVALAPEAQRLVPAIIAAYPGAVATAALRNAAAQVVRMQVGDALVPDYLNDAVAPKLALYFPAAELARYQGSRQLAGRLTAPPDWLQFGALGLGLIGTVGLLLTRRWRPFAGVVLVALLANAGTTGALSAPHDRYQARVAWLLLLPPLYAAIAGAMGARRSTSAGFMRTRSV